MRRWRVERAGDSRGYLPGWFALCDGIGAWFPTWQLALDFTTSSTAHHFTLEATA